MAILKNPIRYISRTYNTIINDINSDSALVDKPNWFKRIWAGIGDVISMWINAAANNSLLRTAFTRQAVADLTGLIDYQIGDQSTSSGTNIFFVSTTIGAAIFPFTVLEANLIAYSQGNLAISSKRFEARADVTFTDENDTFTANVGNDQITLGGAIDFVLTGHKVRVSSTVTLPVPLQANTDYYVIYGAAATIYLSTSLADAFAGNFIDITNAGAGVHTIQKYSKTVTMYQQETLSAYVTIGQSDGISEWQQFTLPDKLVLSSELTIRINAITWTKVDSFVDSISSSKHFKVIHLSDNQFAARFGNGTYGAIPGEFDIEALYSFGGGSDTNITALNSLTIYSGTDTNLI